MINTVIFDVGNVLVDFDWQDRFAELGCDKTDCQLLEQAVFHSAAWKEFDRSVIPDEELLIQLIANAPAYADIITKIFRNVELLIKMRSYACDWIKDLKARGYRVYILSNYPRLTYERSGQDLIFLAHADGALFSFECGCIKPEPQIYQELIDRFSIIPEEAIFIDDLPANLETAKSFGIHTLLFSEYEETAKALEQLLKS